MMLHRSLLQGKIQSMQLTNKNSGLLSADECKSALLKRQFLRESFNGIFR